jgi:hypothetical protein
VLPNFGYVTQYDRQYEKSKRLFKWVDHDIYSHIFEESKGLGIKDHAHFVACLIQAESEGKRKAHGPETESGRARGLMQIMPFHVKRKDRDRLFDSKFNIRVGVKILSGFIRNRKGDLVEALKDYNSGPASHYYNITYIREILTNYRRVK